MPDAPGATGQEPGSAPIGTTITTPAPTTPATSATPASTGQEPEEEFDKERALATIRKLREQEKLAKAQTKELEQLRGQAKAAEEAQLTEQQKLAKRAEEAAAKVAELERQQTEWARERQELTTRHEVMTEAARLNIVDPDAAYRLLDLAALEFDDSGKPKNVKAVLAKLVQAKPYLVGATAASPANPARGDNTPQETTEQRRRRLQGGGFDPFDLATVRAKGGGVLFDPAVNPRQRKEGFG